jgi:hypothetical protein
MGAPTGRTFLVQHLHLGETGNVRTFQTATLNNGGAGPWLGQLGQVFEKGGKFYRLVKFDNGAGNVASIDGGIVYWKTKADWVVTTDASDSEGLANGVAGGTHVVVTDGNYFFIQIGGDQAAVQVAASTVNGDKLTGHATTDNILTRTAAGTAAVDDTFAVALTTRGTTTTDEAASLANSSKVRWVLGRLL